MYPVNSTFHNLSTQDAPKTRVRIYFIGEGVDCTDDVAVQTSGTLLVGAVGDTDSNGRIGQNGISFTEMFNPDKNIQIGTAVSYQIGMTLLNTDGALNGFSYGRCKVYLDVYDAANSAWRACPMGVFIIDIPTKRRVQLVSATGYDQMQLLDTICDTWWSGLNWSGGLTLLQILNSMAAQRGVFVSANTASALVNSSVTYTEPPFSCVEVTYREVLEYIAEATGTIARFDRDGYLDLRFFSAAQIGGNTVTINADTVGNTCLDIDIAEYQAAAIGLLKVKIAEDDIGVTVGSGTNQYTIVNNLFLYGSTATIITNRATPIYNRLNGLGAYTPIQAKLIYDWSLEAGDIINIVRGSTTYPVLIFQQTLTWRGGYVTADILADGDNVRPVMDYDERASYRMASEMSQKVGDNEIISKINQTAESIQIQASRVDLAGYVTFTNLSTSGQTTINGGNITTGTIDASTVTVSNINASNISSGTLSADRIAAGSLAIGKLDSAAQNTINGANSQEQLIYRSKVAGTTSLSKTTTWITNTTGNQDTWTLKRPTYNSSYPVLFVATQRKDVGGAVTCTTPQIDNTTTVIDGGNIITGTVTANKLNAADINASKILTVGSMTDAAAETILNSNIAIGGRNIATGTATAQTLTTAANQNWFSPSVYPLSAYSATALSDASNTQVTVSFDYSITGVDTSFSLTVGFWGGQSYNQSVIAKAGIPIGSSTGHAEATKDITDNMRQYAHGGGVLFSNSGNANASAVLTVSNFKVEIGNKATSWTQAPEDVAADIATAQTTADSANSQEQLIYISKVSGTTTQSGTTTWVTNATGNQNVWTIKRPTYNSSYPVLFVATQRKSVGGIVTCTTPQIDNTTTVIDGGHITTGTIDASVVSVTNLNASNITSGTMSASKISGGTLTLGGSNNTNGTMTVKDANGNTAATVNNNGITINGSTSKTVLDGGVVKIQNASAAAQNVSLEYVPISGTSPAGYVQKMYTPSSEARTVSEGFWWYIGNKSVAEIYSAGDSVANCDEFVGLGVGWTPISGSAKFVVDKLRSSDIEAKNLSVYGVLDVTNLRTSAVSLSTLGWYRAIRIAGIGKGGRSFAIDICIGRNYSHTNNEIHKITLLAVRDSLAFVNETSKSNTKIISAIRYTWDSNGNGYIDIQYSSLNENSVYVDFAVHCYPGNMANFTAQSLQSVADSPSGETVLKTYTFASNTNDFESATKDANFSASTFTLTGYRRGDVIIYRWNINVPALTAATYYNMGTFSNIVPPTEFSVTWAGQGTGQYLISFKDTGLVRIYSNSATSAQFCRGTVTFPA